MSELNTTLNKAQKGVALHIVRGNLNELKEQGIKKTYFDVPFDTRNNKLVAFTARVAVTMGNTYPYLDIFKYVVSEARRHKKNVFSCAKGSRGHCLPHAIANRAWNVGHVEAIRNIVGPTNFNTYAAKPNQTGKTARNHSYTQSVKNYLPSPKSTKKNSALVQKIRSLSVAEQNELLRLFQGTRMM